MLTRKQYRRLLTFVYDEHLYYSDMIQFAIRMTWALMERDAQDADLQKEYRQCQACLKMAKRHADRIERWKPKRPGKGNKK